MTMTHDTTTLSPFRVTTVAGTARHTITVVAKDKAAAAAAAVTAHRAQSGLARNAAVLTDGVHKLARTQQAPPEITSFQRRRNAEARRRSAK